MLCTAKWQEWTPQGWAHACVFSENHARECRCECGSTPEKQECDCKTRHPIIEHTTQQ